MLTSRIRVHVREGRATPNYRGIVCFKLCKIVLSSSNSTSTLEARGKCTCNVMLMARKFHCILADDVTEVNSFATSFDCQPGIVILLR